MPTTWRESTDPDELYAAICGGVAVEWTSTDCDEWEHQTPFLSDGPAYFRNYIPRYRFRFAVEAEAEGVAPAGVEEVARLCLPMPVDKLGQIASLLDDLYGADEGDGSGIFMHQDGDFLVFTKRPSDE